MPRLTAKEYQRALDLGFEPDRLTLDELGKVRYGEDLQQEADAYAEWEYQWDLKTIDLPSEPRQMGYQPALFSRTPEPPPRALVAPEYPEGSTIKERFEIFNAKNPHIRNKLRRMALELKYAGHQHYGIKALIEVLRWDYAVRTRSGKDFKINNAFATPYAHLLMAQTPDLRGFFKTRQRKETPNV